MLYKKISYAGILLTRSCVHFSPSILRIEGIVLHLNFGYLLLKMKDQGSTPSPSLTPDDSYFRPSLSSNLQYLSQHCFKLVTTRPTLLRTSRQLKDASTGCSPASVCPSDSHQTSPLVHMLPFSNCCFQGITSATLHFFLTPLTFCSLLDHPYGHTIISPILKRESSPESTFSTSCHPVSLYLLQQ